MSKKAKDGVISSLAENAGMTMKELGERFGIPYRTLQDWNAGSRKAPEYTINMLKEALAMKMEEKCICRVRLINAFFLKAGGDTPDPWNPQRVRKFETAEEAIKDIKDAFYFFKDGNSWFETSKINTIQFEIEPIPVDADDEYKFSYLFNGVFNPMIDFYSYSEKAGFYSCTGEKGEKPTARKLKEKQMISIIASQPELLAIARRDDERRRKSQKEWEAEKKRQKEEAERKEKEAAVLYQKEKQEEEAEIKAAIDNKVELFIVDSAYYVDGNRFKPASDVAAYNKKDEALNAAEEFKRDCYSVEVGSVVAVPNKKAYLRIYGESDWVPQIVDYNGTEYYYSSMQFEKNLVLNFKK